MAFKPNYQQQRSDRDRAKEQKKQEKLRKREADAARRKSDRDVPEGTSAGDVGTVDPE